MTTAAIKADGVGKLYRLGTTGADTTLTDRLGRSLSAPRRLLGHGAATRQPPDELWALRDVSFEVAQGEVVGLIGANGAGKSTLLKVLSRITPPTEGRIELRGKVGSLLEVGTGFHPELTGRENVYLNGAILGMRQREIDRQFDEIAEFSGVERFLDTPVKRYSSGMHVRLAFAVAAHLQPEILLVDEVLAVGDAKFQRKCLGKMADVAEHGRTIVFVSHNLSAVRRLCSRALLIQGGRLVEDGPSGEVIAAYLGDSAERRGGEIEVSPDHPRSGLGGVRLARIALLDSNGSPTDSLYFREGFSLVLIVDVEKAIPDLCAQFGISTTEGLPAVTINNIDSGRPPMSVSPGRHVIRADIEVPLLPGEFTVDAHLSDSGGKTLDGVEQVLRFTTVNAAADGADLYPWSTVVGAVGAKSDWSLVDEPRPVAPLR